jgi:competence protein ComFC
MSGFLSRVLFPTACPLCGTLQYPAEVEREGCCPRCKKENIYPAARGKVVLPSFVPSCGEVYCCSFYGGKMKQAMTRFKFSGETYIGPCFGRMVYRFLSETEVLGNTDMITAVPVSPERFRERGYNQSLIISREISRLSGIETVELLERRVQGTSQSGLLLEERQRGENKFSLKQDAVAQLAGKSVLLLDDILTTGSTLNHCGALLYKGGAAWVTGVCVTGGRRDFI